MGAKDEFAWEGKLWFIRKELSGEEKYEWSRATYRVVLADGFLVMFDKKIWKKHGKSFGSGSAVDAVLGTVGAAAGGVAAAILGAALLPVVAAGVAISAVANSSQKASPPRHFYTLQEILDISGVPIEETLIAPAKTVRVLSKKAGRSLISFGLDPSSFDILLTGTFLEGGVSELEAKIQLKYDYLNSQKNVVSVFRDAGFTFDVV